MSWTSTGVYIPNQITKKKETISAQSSFSSLYWIFLVMEIINKLFVHICGNVFYITAIMRWLLRLVFILYSGRNSIYIRIEKGFNFVLENFKWNYTFHYAFIWWRENRENIKNPIIWYRFLYGFANSRRL